MSFDKKLEHLIDEALREDIGDGDHSTLSIISPTEKGKAVLKIKQEYLSESLEPWSFSLLFKDNKSYSNILH